MKIVFTENWLFKDKFLEKVGGANAPPAPPAPPPMYSQEFSTKLVGLSTSKDSVTTQETDVK